MVLKPHAFAIINGDLPGSDEDRVECFQFVNDNGYVDELTPIHLLELRHLVETGIISSPVLYVTTCHCNCE